MRTGVAYLGHHNPRHLGTDLQALRSLDCDDVLLAVQEIDFHYFPGKLQSLPAIATDLGLRPVVILWGVLNLFGGGRSSQFLLEHPECHQLASDGSWRPAGCYNNPACVAHIKEMIDRSLERGFQGYFIDEPPCLDCYCPSCRRLFSEWFATDLRSAEGQLVAPFRRRCLTHYVATVAGHVKTSAPSVETFCCMAPEERGLWPEVAALPALDNLGTDLYWANTGQKLEDLCAPVRELAALCKAQRKRHHEWLQCWGVRAGNERRIGEMGRVLCGERPDALFVWAFEGQVGTNEACDDPSRAWTEACALLRRAKHERTSAER